MFDILVCFPQTKFDYDKTRQLIRIKDNQISINPVRALSSTINWTQEKQIRVDQSLCGFRKDPYNNKLYPVIYSSKESFEIDNVFACNVKLYDLNK